MVDERDARPAAPSLRAPPSWRSWMLRWRRSARRCLRESTMRGKQPDRRLCFYDLLDALRQPGCPLCHLAAEASERWLRSLFHEQVTDAETRLLLRRQGAFCARHTEQALRTGDPLGSSIIYGDLARCALDAFPAKWNPKCPLCEQEEQVLGAMRNTLLDHIEEEDVRVDYEASDGLCLPHLYGTVGRGRDPRADVLLAIERGKIDALSRECAGFVAKSHYDHPGELTRGEATAWRRAARKLGGGHGN